VGRAGLGGLRLLRISVVAEEIRDLVGYRRLARRGAHRLFRGLRRGAASEQQAAKQEDDSNR
jgi:hypothetical protein